MGAIEAHSTGTVVRVEEEGRISLYAWRLPVGLTSGPFRVTFFPCILDDADKRSLSPRDRFPESRDQGLNRRVQPVGESGNLIVR